MSDLYVMNTKNSKKQDFNIGDIVYAKKDKATNECAFYEINGTPGKESIGKYVESVRGEKRFVDKFDVPVGQRKLFIVKNIDEFDYYLEFLYQEDDTFKENNKASYKNMIYRIENGRIVICGISGNLQNVIIPGEIDGNEVYAIGNMDEDGIYRPLEMNSDYPYKITLPETVKEIYPNAFMNKWISEINFSNSLYYIGEKAFYGCRVSDINISHTKVDSIERECFMLSSLENIQLPYELSLIKQKAFKYSNVKNVKFNSTLLLVEKEAFFDCNIDTNRTKIGKVEKNAFTCETPLIEKECEYISYDDIKFHIYGRLEFDDFIKDKILEDEHIDSFCECKKQVFFAKDGKQKYEVVIEYDEEYGNDNLYLEWLKYQKCVRLSLYRVENFNLTRHFEDNIPDYEDIKLSWRDEECEINIKTEDGKITGIKLSDKYRYNYEDWIYNAFNMREFNKTNKFLVRKEIFDEDETKFVMNTEENVEYNDIKNEFNSFIFCEKDTINEKNQ